MEENDKSSSIFITVNGVSIPVVQELVNSLNNGDSESQELLKKFVFAEEERGGNNIVTEGNLPIIDMEVLSNSSQHMVELANACENWGFFQIVNHGIPLSLLKRMQEVSKEFFNLPLQERLKLKPGTSREGYGWTVVFSDKQQLPWADSLTFTTLPEHHRNYRFWPESPQQFREITDKYVKEVNSFIVRLIEIFGKNLDFDPYKNILSTETTNVVTMRINYYPPCPQPEVAMGICPHSDLSMLTVLLQDDDVSGLQIRREEKDEWFVVNPIPGALVVNIGDALEVMTNGRYKSIRHRATTNSEKPRMSVATFYDLPQDAQISPLPDFIDEEHPPSYKTFNKVEFMDHYFSKCMHGKKVSYD